MCFSSIVNSSGTIPKNNASVAIKLNSSYGNAQPRSDDAEIYTDESRVESSDRDTVIIDRNQRRTTKTKRRKYQKPGFTAKNKVRHFVTHDYHDRSNITKNDILLAAKLKCSPSDLTSTHDREALSQTGINDIDDNDESLLLSKNNRRRGVKIPFPNKLHEIVEQAANQGFDDIISWCPHGRAFIVHDGKRFEEEVMPKYFKQTCKLTSFQRQLNLYGFLKLSRPEDFGAYYHEYFLRGRDFLCDFIERTKVKGIGYKGARDPKLEPNFYRMPFVQVNKSGEKQQNVCCDDSNKVSVEPVNNCVCSVSCSSSNNENLPRSSLERHSIDSRSKAMSVVEKSNYSSCNPVMPPLDPCKYTTGNVLCTATTYPVMHPFRYQINSLLYPSKAVLSPSVNEYQQPAGINVNFNLTNISSSGISQTTPYYNEPYPHIPQKTMATLPTQTQEGLNKNDPDLQEFARLWFKN